MEHNQLHELIHSLTKSEKRYFKLSAATFSEEREPLYIKIFEILESQAKFNEADLLEKLGEKEKGNKLATAKNYLYNAILSSLESYYSEKNSRIQMSSMITRIEILLYKGLYKQCNKLLYKAKQFGLKHELFPQLLMLGKFEHELASIVKKFNKRDELLSESVRDQEKFVIEMQGRNELEKHQLALFRFINTHGAPKNTEEKALFSALKKSPLLDESYLPETFYARNIYHYIHSAYAYFLGDSKNAYHHALERIKNLEALPGFIESDAHTYVKALYNFIQSALSLRKFSIAIEYIEKAKSLKDKYILDKITSELIFTLIYAHRIRIHLDLGEFDKVLKLGEELKKMKITDFEKEEQNENHFFIYFKIAFCAVVEQQYGSALFWTNLVLNDRNNTVRPDVLGFIRILHLLIHFEMNNLDILDSYSESTKRFFMGHDRFSESEKLILLFFKKVSKLNPKDPEFKNSIQETYEKLSELREQNFSSFVQIYDIPKWLKSKISEKSFKTLLIEDLVSETDS